MAIDARMSEREYTKFTESATTPGEVVLKVANVDGTDIGGGGESSSVTLLAGTATAGKFYITDGVEDVNVNASNELEVAETNSTAILTKNTGTEEATQTLATAIYESGDTNVVETVIGIGGYDGTSPRVLATDSSGNIKLAADTNDIGYTSMFRRADAIQAHVYAGDATSGTNFMAAVAGKRIYLTDIVISPSADMYVWIRETIGGELLIQNLNLPANSVWSKTWSTPIMTAVAKGLDIWSNTSDGDVTVTATGYQV